MMFQIYLKNLTIIGLVVSEIICVIKIVRDDRQTETGNHFLDSITILPSLILEKKKIGQRLFAAFWKNFSFFMRIPIRIREEVCYASESFHYKIL